MGTWVTSTYFKFHTKDQTAFVYSYSSAAIIVRHTVASCNSMMPMPLGMSLL
jgi:hypothetical protein